MLVAAPALAQLDPHHPPAAGEAQAPGTEPSPETPAPAQLDGQPAQEGGGMMASMHQMMQAEGMMEKMRTQQMESMAMMQMQMMQVQMMQVQMMLQMQSMQMQMMEMHMQMMQMHGK
jgi:hypothetical protein